MVTSALPFSLLALVLLLAILFITLRPTPPRLKIVITIAVILGVPLVLAPLLNYLILLPPIIVPIISAISILPAVYLLDDNLRQNARHTTALAMEKTDRRHITKTSQALLVTTLVILLIALMLNNRILLFTDIILALYLLAIMIRIFLSIPRLPVAVPAIRKRVIAGDTTTISLSITSKASLRLHSLISPLDSWCRVIPQRFTLHEGKTNLNFTFTPPLAGPSCPQLQISFTDPWGFVQTNQLLEPVTLHVIPRARYAEWLALKYLEQARGGGTAASTLPPKAILLPKRGVEYLHSRDYQPGDRLRDIDWKHTLKSSQIIIKEYIEAGEQAAILAINLSVTDAEAADKLAFNLITAALTLARESIPTALAAYNHQRVVLTTTVTDPGEILKQTLMLVKEITPAEFTQRCLQLPDINKLRRNIAQLKQVKSESAQRLLGMLDFEYRAIEKAAKAHPATIALSSATENTPVPAMIVLVSQLNHDAEALLVTTEKLSRREFTTILIDTTR